MLSSLLRMSASQPLAMPALACGVNRVAGWREGTTTKSDVEVLDDVRICRCDTMLHFASGLAVRRADLMSVV